MTEYDIHPTTHQEITAAEADHLPNGSVIRYPEYGWPIVRQGGQWRTHAGDASTDVEPSALVIDAKGGIMFQLLFVPEPPVPAPEVGELVTLAQVRRMAPGAVLVNGRDTAAQLHTDPADESARWWVFAGATDEYSADELFIGGLRWRLAWTAP